MALQPVHTTRPSVIPRALGCWMSWLIFGNTFFLYLAIFFLLTPITPISNLFGGLGPNVGSEALAAFGVCLVFWLLHYAAMYSLDRRTSWAYPANLVLMFVMLFIFPFGTGIAAWCLYELFSRPSALAYLRRDDLAAAPVVAGGESEPAQP